MQKWVLFKENGQYVIRRWENGKYKRLPIAQYKRIRDDYEALKALVERKNAPMRTKAAVALKHAFISTALLDEYQEYLSAQIPTQQNAVCEYGYLRKYFLDYFVETLGIENPVEWHLIHKTKWAKYLLDLKFAPTTLRHIIMAANRFMGWLHAQRPAESPPLYFQPLPKARFKEIAAERELDASIKRRKIIPDEHWKQIQKNLPPEIASAVHLAYYYGLRRSETLALTLQDVRKEYLSVERQCKNAQGDTKALKGRNKRKVPHWIAKPIQAYEWIKTLEKQHPHTLTDRWNEHLTNLKLGYDYDFHDLRHTFITKVIRGRDPRDVQLAAGHKDLKTTLGYMHDDRDFGTDVFDPNAA